MESIGIETEVTVNLSSSLIKGSNDQTNFSHTLLLTNTQISKTRKAFANGSSANRIFRILIAANVPILGTLAAIILGSALTRKGVIRADEGVIRADQSF